MLSVDKHFYLSSFVHINTGNVDSHWSINAKHVNAFRRLVLTFAKLFILISSPSTYYLFLLFLTKTGPGQRKTSGKYIVEGININILNK